jgi:para-aminobenzoate synthetase component 1
VATTQRTRHERRVTEAGSPEALLTRLSEWEHPVMVPFAGHVIVAANPVEVVDNDAVWDALAIPCRGASDGPLGVVGGWIGLLAYDFGGTVERLPTPHTDPGGPPRAWAGRYETVAIFDPYGECRVATTGASGALEALEAEIRAPASTPPAATIRGSVSSSFNEPGYRAAVARARKLIRAGDSYQINLTQRLTCAWNDTPRSFADALWRQSGPTSHRAYLGLDAGTVVSASPELLVRVRDGIAVSEPIKGTAPIGAWEELSTSPKDRAEHVMIVDLVRNDLGRVARAGGVSVPRLFEYLSTPYVEHMVSEVRAALRPDVSATDVLRAVFPGGSVTGAPKVRSMEIIRELEPVSRGPAFGSVVAVGTDGAVEASVAIRTAWVTPGEVRYWCGGGVVWDSTAESEWAEAWAKAAPFLRAVGAR